MPEIVVTVKATLGVCVKEDGTIEVTVKGTEGEACVAVCEQPEAAKAGGGGAGEEEAPA